MKTQKISLEAGIDAALACGKILKKYYGRTLNVREKIGAGVVTQADCEAEKMAVKILSKANPDFSFLGEEGIAATFSAKKPKGRWIIDPLDGTTNFVHGFPYFCVSLAAEWDGLIQVGVIYHPIHDELYTCVRGKGAFMNGKKIKVSSVKRLKDALLTTGFSYQTGKELDTEIRRFGKMSKKAQAIRRPGSAALDLAYTARGIFDAFWEKDLSPWDIAAGSLLVTEAGGRVSQRDGEIIASNMFLHRELTHALEIP